MSRIEEEILAEIRSLQLYNRWEDYIHVYAHINKEDFQREMKKALGESISRSMREHRNE